MNWWQSGLHGSVEGLTGTQVEFGWQIHPFGIPAFLTPSARICPGHALLSPTDAGVSLA